MITPEDIPTVTPPRDPQANADVTIIHAHAINAFAFDNATGTFHIIPFNTNFGPAMVGTNGIVYNVDVLHPSPADLANTNNARGYNWVLVGNINPITFNAQTRTLFPGTPGAIFYRGNIATEFFRLTEQQLNTLLDNANSQIFQKKLENTNKPVGGKDFL